MRVFVHLAYGFDANAWNERYRNGKLMGINEPFPYGYHHAIDLGCKLDFSRDHPESILTRGFRGAARLVLGFDFLHAFRNRAELLKSDVVWTHTESQHLAILALLALLRPRHRPKVIAQSVWLFDRWRNMTAVRRALYTRLMRRADLLTFLSPLNADLARKTLPGAQVHFVPFGIRDNDRVEPRFDPHKPLRILSLGNDRDRDWRTLLAAFGGDAGREVRIASRAVSQKLLHGLNNICLVHPHDNEELLSLFDWADLVFVPLSHNLHASGITVILEAIIRGKPVVSTKVGGLESYFSEEEITYVEPGDVEAARRVVETLVMNADTTLAKAARAQGRLRLNEMTSRGYVRRHVQFSRELLARRCEPTPKM